MNDINGLDKMSEREERAFWACFLRALRRDAEHAAQEHLLAGNPVYFCDDSVPCGIIRQWPEGQMDLVHVDENGHVTVLEENWTKH